MNKADLAPIALFVYNRPWHTEQTLEALRRNRWAKDSIIYIYADGPKNGIGTEELEKINEVRKLVNSISWCKEIVIVERDSNFGLANSIISGVTDVVKSHGKIIVLEDDIVTSPGFLDYMNQALTMYAEEERVMHISGYRLPSNKALPNSFFYNITTCWGWATWDRAWESFNQDAAYLFYEINRNGDWNKFNLDNSYPFYGDLVRNIDGRICTWAVKWYASVFIDNGFCLHPGMSLVRNIGHDGSGVHCSYNSVFDKQKLTDSIEIERIELEESLLARKVFREFYMNQNKISYKERIIKYISKYI